MNKKYISNHNHKDFNGEESENSIADYETVLARKLAERWWNEGKLSYNWSPSEDVDYLAKVIKTKLL